MSGFQVRKRLPPLPMSGVKKPVPVAVGTVFVWESSVGVRLTGGGRGGNISSISGIDPMPHSHQLLFRMIIAFITTHPVRISPRKPPIVASSRPRPVGNLVMPSQADCLSKPWYQIDSVKPLRREILVQAYCL
jgi:hypothetical protein